MADPTPKADELAGTEQPFVQHLVELRDRILYSLAGVVLFAIGLAIWPGPGELIDFIAIPIRNHMPPDAKLIAVGVFSPFFVPLKVLLMSAMIVALPWLMYQMWAFVAPGLYSHEKRFALPLIFIGSLLAYGGIAFVQFFVLDQMFFFIQGFTPDSVAATPDIASYVQAILSLYLAFGLAFQVPAGALQPRDHPAAQGFSRLFHRLGLRHRRHRHAARCDLATGAGHTDVHSVSGGHLGVALV